MSKIAKVLVSVLVAVSLVGVASVANAQYITDSQYTRLTLGNTDADRYAKPHVLNASRALHAPVATTAALTAIPAASRYNGMLVYVYYGDGSLYYFDALSTTSASGTAILAPDAGSGRWFLVGGMAAGSTVITGTLDVSDTATFGGETRVNNDFYVKDDTATSTYFTVDNDAVTPLVQVGAADFSVNSTAFTVAAATGNTLASGTLTSTGNFDVNTTMFTVDASNGNTVVDGTLTVGEGELVLGSTAVAATAAEINAVADKSANGAARYFKKFTIDEASERTSGDHDTGIAVGPGEVVLSVWFIITTEETTATSETISVGYGDSGAGTADDADAFLLASASDASGGFYTSNICEVTAGATETYYSGHSGGAELQNYIAGTNTDGDFGLCQAKVWAGGPENVYYTLSAGHTELVGTILVEYISASF